MNWYYGIDCFDKNLSHVLAKVGTNWSCGFLEGDFERLKIKISNVTYIQLRKRNFFSSLQVKGALYTNKAMLIFDVCICLSK